VVLVAVITEQDSRRHERMMIDEARARRSTDYVDRAVQPHESIPRLLGDELIDAAQETVRAWVLRDQKRLDAAVRWLAKLVGGLYL